MNLCKMGPRWKGKTAEAKALAHPMSTIVAKLSLSLTESNARGLITGHSVLLAVEAEQTDLLTRACFGRPIINADKDKKWFQLGFEEAFYLHYNLKCLKIVSGDDCEMNVDEIWQYMSSKMETFSGSFRAFSHLRAKNWVVRPGSQYGVDFVVYRHHPCFVHSEYAVIVLDEGDSDGKGRLRVWSDVYCAVRLCGSVAKTLLVLSVAKNGSGDFSPLCLEGYSVEEHVISRWSSEQSREDQSSSEKGTN